VEGQGLTDRLAEVAVVDFKHLVRAEEEVDFTAEGICYDGLISMVVGGFSSHLPFFHSLATWASHLYPFSNMGTPTPTVILTVSVVQPD